MVKDLLASPKAQQTKLVLAYLSLQGIPAETNSWGCCADGRCSFVPASCVTNVSYCSSSASPLETIPAAVMESRFFQGWFVQENTRLQDCAEINSLLVTAAPELGFWTPFTAKGVLAECYSPEGFGVRGNVITGWNKRGLLTVSLAVDAIFGQTNPLLCFKLYLIYCHVSVSKFQETELHFVCYKHPSITVLLTGSDLCCSFLTEGLERLSLWVAAAQLQKACVLKSRTAAPSFSPLSY